jgi:hypothetical protein
LPIFDPGEHKPETSFFTQFFSGYEENISMPLLHFYANVSCLHFIAPNAHTYFVTTVLLLIYISSLSLPFTCLPVTE